MISLPPKIPQLFWSYSLSDENECLKMLEYNDTADYKAPETMYQYYTKFTYGSIFGMLSRTVLSTEKVCWIAIQDPWHHSQKGFVCLVPGSSMHPSEVQAIAYYTGGGILPLNYTVEPLNAMMIIIKDNQSLIKNSNSLLTYHLQDMDNTVTEYINHFGVPDEDKERVSAEFDNILEQHSKTIMVFNQNSGSKFKQCNFTQDIPNTMKPYLHYPFCTSIKDDQAKATVNIITPHTHAFQATSLYIAPPLLTNADSDTIFKEPGVIDELMVDKDNDILMGNNTFDGI
jgi:hypothetical protein